MSAVKIIRALLVASGAVTALAAVEKIVSGMVPQGTSLPALGISEVGATPIGAIDAQAEFSLVVSRVQVTVMANDYPAVKALLKEVRKACNFQRGSIAGISVASIVRDTVGPDFSDDAAAIHFQTIDFKVTFHEQN